MRLHHAVLTLTTVFGIVGGCAEDPPRKRDFVAMDDRGDIAATVTMEHPLPPQDTSLTFAGPSVDGRPSLTVQPMTFETAGAFQCHWSTLVVICSTEEQDPAPAKTDEGLEVRRIDENTILVASTLGGLDGDFAQYRDGKLIAFGTRDELGQEAWRYDIR